MNIIADLGKVTENKNLIVIEKANHLEYVIARNYNADEGSWASGEYYYSLEGIAEAILGYKRLMSYMRLQEIAEKAIDAIHVNGEDWEEELINADLDLTPEEKEYFGIEENEDEGY